MFTKCIIATISGAILFWSCSNEIESDWKGPFRDGIFYESGLLKEWPADGPELLWRYDGLHMGHSSPAVTKENIYVTGMPDSTTGVLYCLDLQGNLLWEEVYGEEYKTNYTGSRSTPVVTNRALYLLSGAGEIVCYDLKSRSKKWVLDLVGEYADSIPKYGHAQSVLIHGHKLYCTPGGEKFNVLCLNRKSGDLIWSSKGNGEKPTYSSPILANHNGREILVTVTQNSILGLDARDGNLLWTIPFPSLFVNHVNTPVYYKGKILMATDAIRKEGGIMAIELNSDGSKASPLWQRTDIRNLLNGFIIQDDLLFGSFYMRNDWYCLDVETGKTVSTWKGYPYGTITFADGQYFVLTNDGNVLLCEGSDQGFRNISKFQLDISIYYPFAPLWPLPVIKDKRLYIRHKGSLFVYNIAAD